MDTIAQWFKQIYNVSGLLQSLAGMGHLMAYDKGKLPIVDDRKEPPGHVDKPAGQGNGIEVLDAQDLEGKPQVSPLAGRKE